MAEVKSFQFTVSSNELDVRRNTFDVSGEGDARLGTKDTRRMARVSCLKEESIA
jgi:hypothetical protein